MSHFDEMTALLYLDGQLERAQASEVLLHATRCAECRSLLESLKSETVWLEQSLQERDPVPVQFAAGALRAHLPWGWITALGIVVAGILTVWNGIIEPLEHQLNQVGFSGGNLLNMLFFGGAFWKGWSSVLSFLGFFAVAVLAILILFLFQRFWRRSAAVGIVLANTSFLALLVVLLLLTPSAHAGEVVHGHPSYTLPAGQTVNTDLFVFADFARIDGTVNGDVFAWGNQVEVNGHITGDLIIMARELDVNGRVDGSIRSYLQTLNINGRVGKNVLAGCQGLELGPSGSIGGSLTLGSGNAMLSGNIGRDIMAASGETTIDGLVGGGVKLKGNDLRVGSHANISGPIAFKGRRAPEVDPGAKLASPVAFTKLKQVPNYASWSYYRHRIEFWAAAFLFGLVLLLLIPRFFANGLRTSKHFLPAFGFGILFLIATPIVAILICITLVGLGIGIATLLLWFIAVYAAQVFVASWIGDLLLGPSAGTGALLGRLALGLAIIHALEMIPYHVGIVVHVIVFCWGLGAIVMAIFSHLRRPTVVAPPVPV